MNFFEEEEKGIFFHCENITLPIVIDYQFSLWIEKIITSENLRLGSINYIICSDDYLLQLNKKHLNHNTFTDIITFDYREKDIASADIYISIERVQENSKVLKTKFLDEFSRVLAHGVLHIAGYKDKTKEESSIMRTKEDYYLSLRPF